MSFFKRIGNHLVAPKAEVNLQLDQNYVVLGDDLQGTLVISPREDIEATEIRCELNCTETAKTIRMQYDPALKRNIPQEVTERRCLYVSNPVCSPAIQLMNGITKDFRFNINIPAGGRPTFVSTDNSVVWEIKGVIAIHGRPDVTTQELVLQVIPESQRPTNEAPKIRLVACEYCQTGMPETILACPNCGARRKAQ